MSKESDKKNTVWELLKSFCNNGAMEGIAEMYFQGQSTVTYKDQDVRNNRKYGTFFQVRMQAPSFNVSKSSVLETKV